MFVQVIEFFLAVLFVSLSLFVTLSLLVTLRFTFTFRYTMCYILECKVCQVFIEVADALEWEAHQDTHRKDNFVDYLYDTSVCSNSSIHCAICCEESEMKSPVRLLPCKHRFHKRCIDTWIRTLLLRKKDPSCPLCRHILQEQVL
jgi:hypothetical protein